MKTTVSQDSLASGLRKVLSVVSTRTTIPVLNNVLVEAGEGKLALTTTDLEVLVRTELEAVVEENGITTLPARKFGQLVNALSGKEVHFETGDNESTSITCGNSRFRIVGLDPQEFPNDSAFDAQWSFSLPAVEFRKMVSKVSYAVSFDDPRQVLSGILLSLRSSNLTAVATDGKRLALLEKNLEGDSMPEGDVILPDKVVKELERLLEDSGDISVELSDSRASFAFGGTRITSKLVDGAYPNYRQVIPGGFTKSVAIPREDFADVLNRVSMVVSETSASVKLMIEPAKMTVSAQSPEVGEASEPLEVSFDGEPIQFSFNPYFVADPLRRLECDQLVLQFNDQFSPVSLSGDEGFLYVLMPMRG